MALAVAAAGAAPALGAVGLAVCRLGGGVGRAHVGCRIRRSCQRRVGALRTRRGCDIAYDADDMFDPYGDFKLLPPDPDPDETQDWVASLDALTEEVGRERAQFVLYKLLKRARQLHIGLPPLTQTRYINTISPEQERPSRATRTWSGASAASSAGTRRPWSLRANKASPGIGGHLATYASAASLYEVGFNHFFRGKDAEGMGDQVYYQGHAAPGMYARAFLEGRLTEAQLDHFRREVRAGRGPLVLPASAPDARLLGVPHGLDGPLAAGRHLPGALQPLPAQPRHQGHLRTAACGPSWATARPTSRSRSARSASPRAKASTTSSSWSTATCSASTARSAATARSSRSSRPSSAAPAGTSSRSSGAASGTSCWLATPTVCSCSAWPTSSTASGRSTRSSPARTCASTSSGPTRGWRRWSPTRPTTRLKGLRRGGHDYRKLYAAYTKAIEQNGAPTVILAKTVKGWTLGSSVEARNITHQAKKMNDEEVRVFRDRLELPIPDEQLHEVPYYHPGPDSPGDPVPAGATRRAGRPLAAPRGRQQARSTTPGDEVYGEFDSGSGGQEVSTTMAFAKLLRNLLRDEGIGERIVPIIPDEARTFGMDSLFQEVGIYSALGQLYDPVDSNLMFSYREDKAGQYPRGGHHRGRLDGLVAGGGHVLRHPRRADDPVLHLLLDVRVPAHRRRDLGLRRRPRPRLPDGRHGRPHHPQRRGPAARGRPQPGPRLALPIVLASTTRPSPTRRPPSSRTACAHVRREPRGRLLLRHALQREPRHARATRGRQRRGHRQRASTASRPRPSWAKTPRVPPSWPRA